MNRRTGTARVLERANGIRNGARALAFRGVRVRVGALVLVAAAVGGGLPAAAARADTADLAVAYQINAAHSGVQTDSTLAPPFLRRWKVTLPGFVSYPLIAQGMVFVTVSDDTTGTSSLYALDQRSGQVVWSQELPFVRTFANAAYDGGRIFVVGNSAYCCSGGLMSAFAAETGAPLWTTDLQGQFMFTSPPTAANGVVYTSGAGSAGTLYAVDEATGGVLAKQEVWNGDHSSPALSDGSVFVSYACNQAYGFAQATLAPLWHYEGPCNGGGGATAVYANGSLYTRDYVTGNLVLDAGSGTLLRSYSPLHANAYAPAVDSTGVFTTFPAQMLTAQSLAGAPLWTFSGDGLLNTSPLILNGPSGKMVIVGSWSGRLYALDAASGQERWSTDVGTPISGAGEQSIGTLAGLGAGQGLIVVPALNTLSAYASDHTSPTITVPAPIAVRAASNAGAEVNYTVTASDPDDTATVSCTPPSGSTFPIGVTSVACSATDTAANTSSASFLVVVSAPNAACKLSDYPVTKGVLVLKNANLSGCYLPGANLSGANATNANFTAAYLAGANLSSANLSQAQMQRSVLSNANLSAAKLNLAVLTGATLTGATLTGVTWAQTTCPDGTNSNNNGSTCTGHLG